MDDQQPPTLHRLEEQIDWYDRRSRTAQRSYKALKLAQMVTAALIPLASTLPDFPARHWITAVLGILVLVIEAVQQLNQYQQNWISYRSTSEALKHEKYLYLAEAGPYAGAAKPIAQLADRIEGLISQEHAKWVSIQEQSGTDHPVAAEGAAEAR